MIELRGDISGLLRRGSPVRRIWSGGVVALVHASGAVSVAVSDREIETESPDCYSLDLSDPTGRFHAREWLRERGHDLGSEDRAEVLAWSVLSVHRGGKPLPGVVGAWEQVQCREEWRRQHPECNAAMMNVGRGCEGWQVVIQEQWEAGGPETGGVGKAAADAALLRLGWALTNADGSLTLPPLPEVHNG